MPKGLSTHTGRNRESKPLLFLKLEFRVTENSALLFHSIASLCGKGEGFGTGSFLKAETTPSSLSRGERVQPAGKRANLRNFFQPLSPSPH